MGDYSPLFLPGKVINLPCSADVTGGKPVYVSGDGTVANSAAAANIPIGVAACDVKSGDQAAFFGRGTVHRLVAAGAITAGNVVEAAAAGAVAAHTMGTNDGRIFGIALTTAADTGTVTVMEI